MKHSLSKITAFKSSLNLNENFFLRAFPCHFPYEIFPPQRVNQFGVVCDRTSLSVSETERRVDYMTFTKKTPKNE